MYWEIMMFSLPMFALGWIAANAYYYCKIAKEKCEK